MRQDQSKRDVQIAILAKLLKSPAGLRYSEVKVEGVEDDLYNYHLQSLVKKGLVEKQADAYILSAAGKSRVLHINSTGDLKTPLKVSVLFSAVRYREGKCEMIAEVRKRQPLYGDRGIMAGTVRPGERLVNAASRKLEAEAGLSSNKFKFLGVIRTIRVDAESNILDDTLFHLCLTDEFSGELEVENDYGTHEWADLDTLIKYELASRGKSMQMIKVYQQLHKLKFTEIPNFYVEEVVRFPQGWE